jgi:hypothetical protein
MKNLHIILDGKPVGTGQLENLSLDRKGCTPITINSKKAGSDDRLKSNESG